MTDRYDLVITDSSGESHGLLADWGRGGAGLRISKATESLRSTAVSTKGDFGVRDVTDHFRIVQTDWSQGSGQKTYDRDADSEAAFWESKNIDVGTIGELKLGPKVTETTLDGTGSGHTGLTGTSTGALPTIAAPVIAHGSSTWPLIWGAFSSTETEERIRFSADGVTWERLGNTSSLGPDGTPTSFASDGESLYAAANGHVWLVGTMQATRFGTAPSYDSAIDITHLAFASGTLYGTKGSVTVDAQLGVFTSLGGWSALTPEVTTAINAAGTTFGLVASGNYVYWGITNSMVTKVYKAKFGGGAGADELSAVATFPTGFVGVSMYAYLGTVYIGGHFDGTEPNTGIGSIYAIVGDTPARLTDVGDDRARDNRVLAISAYERNLYFVADSQLWRWDLVNGGYSHFAGPLNSTTLTPYSSVLWDGTYDMTTNPGTGTATGDGFVTYDYNGTANFYVGVKDDAYDVYVDDTDINTNALGNTVEMDIPREAVWSAEGYRTSGDVTLTMVYFYFGISDKTQTVRVNIAKDKNSSLYWGSLKSGSTLLSTFLISDASVAHSIRLTLKGTSAKVYADGALVASGTATAASANERILFGAKNASTKSDHESSCYIDRIRWATGIYDPTDIGTPVTGVGLACFRDKVVATCTGVKSTVSDPTKYALLQTDGTPPYLLSSRSSGNMPTVEKYFSAVHLTLGSPVERESVTVSVSIDGVWGNPIAASTDSTANLLVFPIDRSVATGKVIQWQVNVTSSDELLTPIITEASVVFDPIPKIPKEWTYFIRCWRDAEDNTGHDWDEDAETVSAWLEEIAGTVVSVERAGRASYNGRIEQLDLVEAPPSGKANGREGLFQIAVKEV
jgi:hypothetical protein